MFVFNNLTCKCAFHDSGVKFSTSELPKVVRDPEFFTFWVAIVLFTTAADNFSTSQLQKVPLWAGTSTRRFSEPTFRPSRHTNHWKDTAFRDFPNISCGWIFFLLTFAQLHLLSSDSTSLPFWILHVGSFTKLQLTRIIHNQFVFYTQPCSINIPHVFSTPGFRRRKALRRESWRKIPWKILRGIRMSLWGILCCIRVRSYGAQAPRFLPDSMSYVDWKMLNTWFILPWIWVKAHANTKTKREKINEKTKNMTNDLFFCLLFLSSPVLHRHLWGHEATDALFFQDEKFLGKKTRQKRRMCKKWRAWPFFQQVFWRMQPEDSNKTSFPTYCRFGANHKFGTFWKSWKPKIGLREFLQSFVIQAFPFSLFSLHLAGQLQHRFRCFKQGQLVTLVPLSNNWTLLGHT